MFRCSRALLVFVYFLASFQHAGGFASPGLPLTSFRSSQRSRAPTSSIVHTNPIGATPLRLLGARQSLRHTHADYQPPSPRYSRSFWNRLGISTHQSTGRLHSRLSSVGGVGDSGGPGERRGVFARIKQLHNPITYIVLSLLAGLKWDWCFRSPYYWFGVAFCVKWYRARYVFKIPVWDRQPNWNNIITSKEQEKDLKAFTCKNCGSTLFIAKSREFFFEGGTGIGGLGCFSCGAKGKDNFVMDRERIVEDVADIDDYFEYERPLDFVSAAERRKILKEAGGDEDKANLLLLERTTGIKSETAETTSSADSQSTTVDAPEVDAIDVELVNDAPAASPVDAIPPPPKESPPPLKESPKPKPPKPSSGDDDFDLLGLDG